MYLNHFESSHEARLNQIFHTLKNVYGVEIKVNLESETAESTLAECKSSYETIRDKIIAESSFNSYQQNPEYIKSMLILEAVRLMITEIAPKRRRRHKVAESTIDDITTEDSAIATQRPKTTFSTQLADIAARVPSTSDESIAFSNSLANISSIIADVQNPFSSGLRNLSATEKQILIWIKELPRPINISDMIASGVEKFGPTLVANRSDELSKIPKVPDSFLAAKADDEAKITEAIDDTSDPSIELKSSPKIGQTHHYEYQASMARSELYRNSKYAMAMLKQIDPDSEIQPWIAGSLAKSAETLDKVYHYLDYYKKFEPEKLPEDQDGEVELGENSGSSARQSLMMITEYSIKLFDMIKPGDKLEGWVAMKLTTASESVSSCKHYIDYVQFEKHAMDGHFTEGRRANRKIMNEAAYEQDLDHKKTIYVDYEAGMKATRKRRKFPNFAAYEKWLEKNKNESITVTHVYNESRSLNEQEDLAKASTVLAAKDMSNTIQDIAEDVAKMSVEDLMPLVDIMRGQFGPDAANGFNTSVKTALDELLDLVTKTKETMDAAIDTLNSGGVPAVASDLDTATPDNLSQPPTGAPDDSDISKDLAGLDGGAAATGDMPQGGEPLGRAKKDELNEFVDEPHSKVLRMDGWKLKGPNANIWTNQYAPGEFTIAPQNAQNNGKTWQYVDPAKSKQPIQSGNDFKSLEQFLRQLNSANAVHEQAGKFIKENQDAFKAKYADNWKTALYAAAWKQYGDVSKYKETSIKLQEANQRISKLNAAMQLHRNEFKTTLAEGKSIDPLKLGYGLEGDLILEQIASVEKEVVKIKKQMKSIMQEGVIGMLRNIESLNKSKSLEKIKSTTPYGVVYTTTEGVKTQKMFESADARAYWLKLHKNTVSNAKMIEPAMFDKAISRTKSR